MNYDDLVTRTLDVIGKPPIAFFTKEDAEKALKQAQTVFKKTEKLIQEIPAGKTKSEFLPSLIFFFY